MKAEERHELKENDLEGWIQYGLPMFLKQYGSYILLFLAICLLAYQLWNYHERKKEVELQSAWNELSAAAPAPGEWADNAPAKLQAIINQYQINSVQAQAWLQIASFYVDDVSHGNPTDGFNGVKIDKQQALKSAEDAANHVVSGFPDQTLAVGKAHLTLATIALDRKDWDAAKKQYELLVDKNGPFANTEFAARAEAQLKNLDNYRQAPQLAALAPTPVSTTQPLATPPLPSSIDNSPSSQVLPGLPPTTPFTGPLPSIPLPSVPTTQK